MIDFNKRQISSFGISLPTGLMLESCFTPTEERYDKERAIPNMFNPKDYELYLVNILTLLRNLVESVDLPMDVVIKDKKIWHTLVEEMDIIKNLFSSFGHMKTIFYYPHVLKMQEHYNRNKPKILTKKMEITRDLYVALSKAKLPDLDFYEIILYKDVMVFPKAMKASIKNKKCLITTHIPVDLLNNAKESPLTLLESHTGVLKEEDKFSTKYNKIVNVDMTIFPFREILLYMLGDNYISGITSVKCRSELLKYAPKWDKRISEAGIATYIRKDISTRKFLSGYGSLYKDFFYK